MAANTSLRVSELDFNEIRNNLKNFLRSQSEFQDFDFDGSGMSVLLDLLAYNTHYMGYYLNMVGNEMFMDTAQLRGSILSHAKLTNYVPASRRGAETMVTITIDPVEDRNQSIATLDKYTRFLGADIDGKNYQFVTLNSNTTVKVNGTFTFSNVHIHQGQVQTLQYLVEPTNTKRRFKIPSANVDVDTMVVVVQESTTNTDSIVYNRIDDITNIRGNTYAYFVEEDVDQKYTVYFGDDVVGKKPKDGSVVIVTYLDSAGSTANNISDFMLVGKIDNKYSNFVTITPQQPTYGGREKETVEQVRYRAPYNYVTQNRAVTRLDYETLITRDYTNIDSVSVWGGDEIEPPVFGKVFLSLKTRGNYELTNLEKQRITKDLITSRNMLTVIPEIVDPEYEYILIRGKVTYNPSLTSLRKDELVQYVKAAIQDYAENELNRFTSTFRKSKLQQYIENSEKSITGSDIQIYLQKRQLFDTNNSINYVINFNTPLKKGDYLTKLYSYPEFTVRDDKNIVQTVFIEEVPDSFTGIDKIVVVDPGANYTTTPTVLITGDGVGANAVASIVNGKVESINVLDKGSVYTRAIVTVVGGGGTGAVAQAVLGANLGTLRTFYFKDTGEKVIVNSNFGSVNYDTGQVTLNNVLPISVRRNANYAADIMTINVPAGTEIVPPLRNRIMTLDIRDGLAIQIEMVPE
jgi:hypothetical protein